MSKKSRYGMNFTPVFNLIMEYRFSEPISTTKAGKERYSLNLTEVYIYGVMCSLYYNGCEIYVSVGGLADKIGATDKTVRTAIQNLEEAGIIKVIHRTGTSNIYELLITPDQFAEMCADQGLIDAPQEDHAEEYQHAPQGGDEWGELHRPDDADDFAPLF